MRHAIALRNFMSMPDTTFQNKALTVYAGMNGNTYFPNPTPTMIELDNAIQQYSSALAQAKNKDLFKIEQKNVSRTQLTDVLNSLVRHVNYVAAGNRAMLLTTGLSVSAETTSTASFSGEINNLKVTQGANSGELDVNFKPVTGRRIYVICYGEAPIQNDYWQVKHTIEPFITLSGLERGKEYSVRIGVVSPQGDTFYAAVVTIMAL